METVIIFDFATPLLKYYSTIIRMGENQSVRWLPIIDVSGTNFYLGLTE